MTFLEKSRSSGSPVSIPPTPRLRDLGSRQLQEKGRGWWGQRRHQLLLSGASLFGGRQADTDRRIGIDTLDEADQGQGGYNHDGVESGVDVGA